MNSRVEYFLSKILQFIHIVLLLPYYIYKDLNSSCRNKLTVKDSHGEVAVITGGHRGIGSGVTRDLLESGMHVILGCRNPESGEKFVNSLRKQGITKGTATILPLDLASLASIHSFANSVAEKTPILHYIINNAGILQFEYKETVDNFESTWQVNYLGHFLLTHLLLPTVLSSPGRRMIVNVSSMIHKCELGYNFKPIKREQYDGMTAYARSKLALLMFTLYLNQKLSSLDSSVQVSAVHPGLVYTNFAKPDKENIITKLYGIHLFSKILKSPEEGAKSVTYAVFHATGGQYIDNCLAKQPSAVSRNKDAQKQLFEECKQCLNINLYGGLF